MGAPRERDAARFRGPFERTPGPRSHSFEGRVRVRPGLQSTEHPSHGRGPAAREADHVWSRDALASGRAIVRTVDGAGASSRTDAPRGEGGAPMKAQATCFGAGTIVNAIATGQGAAFGLALRANATVESRPEEFGVNVHVPPGVDPALAMAASRRVLGRFPDDLVAVVQIPPRMTPKASLKGIDFASIRSQVEAAFQVVLRGDYFRALEANSAAYAPILGIDEAPARRAREAGAIAAGITGTGPAILALAKPTHADAVRRSMEDGESDIRVVALDTMESREVML